MFCGGDREIVYTKSIENTKKYPKRALCKFLSIIHIFPEPAVPEYMFYNISLMFFDKAYYLHPGTASPIRSRTSFGHSRGSASYTHFIKAAQVIRRLS